MNIKEGKIWKNYTDTLLKLKESIVNVLHRDAKAKKSLGLPHKYGVWKCARFHEQEARQRYWILRRDIEMNIDNCLSKLSSDKSCFENIKKGENVEQNLEDLMSQIRDGVDKKNRQKNKNSCLPNDKIFSLLYYYRILLIYNNVVSNKLDYLSMLWKDLIFIRTRMLSEGIIESDRVPYQLDFCRSEAANLGAENDPEVKNLMAQAAEQLGLENPSEKNNKQAIRSITSLMVRLNDMRINKLSEQVYKKRMYMTLLTILLILSVLIFSLNDFLIPSPFNKNSNDVAEAMFFMKFNSAQMMDTYWPVGLLMAFWNLVVIVVEYISSLIVSKPTVFVFFAGLAGGFFSAMMRFEPLKKLPGDELYIRWYRITKPFIGAFGATIIYIIVTTGLFNLEFIEEGLERGIVSNPISGIGFTFGFLTGFTERLILPKIE